jgi:hypothetical protein
MWVTLRTPKASWKRAESLQLLCNSPKRDCNSPRGQLLNSPVLSSWNLEDPVPRTLYSALGLIAIAMWQTILAQRSRETWGLPRTPSWFSALLKYSLQKINYAIAVQHNPEFMSLLTAEAPKTRVGAPTAAGLWHGQPSSFQRVLQFLEAMCNSLPPSGPVRWSSI